MHQFVVFLLLVAFIAHQASAQAGISTGLGIAGQAASVGAQTALMSGYGPSGYGQLGGYGGYGPVGYSGGYMGASGGGYPGYGGYTGYGGGGPGGGGYYAGNYEGYGGSGGGLGSRGVGGYSSNSGYYNGGSPYGGGYQQTQRLFANGQEIIVNGSGTIHQLPPSGYGLGGPVSRYAGAGGPVVGYGIPVGGGYGGPCCGK